MIAALGLVALLAQAAPCVDLALDWPFDPRDRASCPQVYRVSGGAPSDEALDIVFLSGSFTEGEQLQRFRCATKLMVERLLEFEPYSCHRDSINFYRIDLAAEKSGVRYDRCAASLHCGPMELMPGDWPAAECAALNGEFGTPLRAPGEFSGGCMRLDLRVGACPESAPWCKVIWPAEDGERSTLWELLSLCVPQFDIAVILADSLDSAGGGKEDTAAHHGLVVTTLNGITRAETRSKLLAHELGHALGLLDEYHNPVTYQNGIQPPKFLSGRNVVEIDTDGSLPDVPWAAMCTDGAGKVTGECLLQCGSDCDDCPLNAHPNQQPKVGLWEGGYYDACRYFKASNDVCRMEDQENDAYCAGCLHHLAEFFDKLHMKSSCP